MHWSISIYWNDLCDKLFWIILLKLKLQQWTKGAESAVNIAVCNCYKHVFNKHTTYRVECIINRHLNTSLKYSYMDEIYVCEVIIFQSWMKRERNRPVLKCPVWMSSSEGSPSRTRRKTPPDDSRLHQTGNLGEKQQH